MIAGHDELADIGAGQRERLGRNVGKAANLILTRGRYGLACCIVRHSLPDWMRDAAWPGDERYAIEANRLQRRCKFQCIADRVAALLCINTPRPDDALTALPP